MPFLLALDQGTTSSRAILFDHAGHIHALAQREFPQIFPQSGWVEHDPDDIWSSQLAVAHEVLQSANLAALRHRRHRHHQPARNHRPLGPPHRPAAPQRHRLAGPPHRRVLRRAQTRRPSRPPSNPKTGLVIDAYFSASKLRWLLDNVPGARARADSGELAFGTVDSWLLWNLTGGALHVTDATNASRTMLFNIHTLQWDDDLLKLFDIPRSILPAVHSSSEVYGHCSPRPLRRAHPHRRHRRRPAGRTLRPDLLRARPRQKHLRHRLLHADEHRRRARRLPAQPAHHRRLAARRHHRSTPWKAASSSAARSCSGSATGSGIVKSAAEIEPLAASVPDTGGVYLVPAFAGLGAPHWDQYARGTISGITRGTTAAHFARAALESIAFQVADILDVMQKDSGVQIKELRVDGGASANNLLLQFQADLLRVPVVRPKVTETTALGAAYLAGLAVNFWTTPTDILANWQIDRTFTPQMPESESQHRRDRWTQALKRSQDWEEH